MKKLILKFFDILAFCLGLGGKTEAGKRAVLDDLCDFSGQGRDRFGN
jgi:hypothetical protein